MPVHVRTRTVANLALAGLLALSFSIFGAVQVLGATAEPKRFVQQFSDSAISTLRDGNLASDERQAQLHRLLRQGFNLDRISKLALGRHWRSASTEDRQAYASVFEQFLLQSYGRRLGAFSDRTVRVQGATPVNRGVMVTSFVEGNGSPIRVGWRLEKTDEGWQIVDLVVEGISMLVTQRNEFAAIIEREGGQLAPLIEHLRLVVASARTST